MADFTTNKVTGSQLTAAEWNQMADVDNFTSSSDQTPATGDLNQIGKGVAAYVGQAGIYTTDSGVADAYVVTQVSPFKAPHKLFIGLTIRFRTSNTNTGACTVNAFTLGVKNIKLDDGSTDPAAGDISTTKENVAVYDGTVFRLKKEPSASTTIKGLVELLTDAELATGTDTERAATAANILSLFSSSSQATNGYVRIPINISGSFDEIIIQWGTYTGGASNPTVNLNLTFPNANLAVFTSGVQINFNTNAQITNVLSKAASNFTAATVNSTNATARVWDFYWLAIGY